MKVYAFSKLILRGKIGEIFLEGDLYRRKENRPKYEIFIFVNPNLHFTNVNNKI